MQPAQTGQRDPQAAAALMETLPADADLELLGDFVGECRDHIQQIEMSLLALETDPEDHEALDTVFRAFHTVKGTAAFLRLTRIAELAHHTESLLSRMRDGAIRCTEGYADLALWAADMLKACTQALQTALELGALVTPAGYETLLQRLITPEATDSSEDVESVGLGLPRLGDILVAEGKVDRHELETVVAEHTGLPLGVALLRAGTASLPDVAHALRTQRRLLGGEGRAEISVRVRAEYLERLVEMIGELVIAQTVVTQDETIRHSAHAALRARVMQVTRMLRELQHLSMTLRMVSLKSTFQKMLRVVRDVAQKSGKLVDLHTQGEETEIDRHVVDMLADPLVHLVRNAVDHGLEPPEVRERLGKRRTGLVQLRAYHASGQVVIELYDDGRGLERDKILQKAIARGCISAGQVLAEHDIWQLIFEPGFSTAEQVTDISGRGVGLDVVRKSVEALHGDIDITSQVGQGTTFRLSLPLTCAYTNGMVVQVSTERYIIPMAHIEQSIRLQATACVMHPEYGEAMQLHDEAIPLIRLARLFDVAGALADATPRLAVVMHDDEKRYALAVDALLGPQQVVAKPLSIGLGTIAGIAGAAILGDGRVSLILDPPGLLALARSTSTASLATGEDAGVLARPRA